MKNNINFSLVNIVSIPSLFEHGIVEYHVEKIGNNRPDSMWLKTGNNAIIKLSTSINEFDNWDEIGSLCLEVTEAGSFNNSMTTLDKSWLKVRRISKLVLIDESIRVECGLKIENEKCQTMIFLPSSFPNAVEMQSDFYLENFEPECSIEDYLDEICE